MYNYIHNMLLTIFSDYFAELKVYTSMTQDK